LALTTWPALQQRLYDGWVVRFARGHTRRANSVNPLYPSYHDLVLPFSVMDNSVSRTLSA